MNAWLKVLIVILVSFSSIVDSKNQLPDSPCPNVFQYTRSGNEIVGIITVNNIALGVTRVEIELSQAGRLQSSYSGELSLNIDQDEAFNYINERRPITFIVKFPHQNVIPKVVSINVNSYHMCSGPEVPTPRTTMDLEYTLRVYSPSSQYHSKRSNSNFRDNYFSDTNDQHFNHMGPLFQPQTSFDYHAFNQQPFYQFPYNQPSRIQPTTVNRHSFNQDLVNQIPEQHRKAYESFLESVNQQQAALNRNHATTNTQNTFFTTPPNYSSNNFDISNNHFSHNFNHPMHPNIQPNNFRPQSPPAGLAINVQNPSWFNKANDAGNVPRNPLMLALPSHPVGYNEIFGRHIGLPTQPNEITTTPPTEQATVEYINSVCGLENANVNFTKLNINGQVIAKSRFPWIVAIFKKEKNDIKFQCGGSLISTKTIVSAAHCFYEGLAVIRPEDILVSMGRHNLTDWTEGQYKDVKEIIRHPQYKPDVVNFDADLAILRLKENVIFTLAIRPVCMWQGPSDPKNIEGVAGIVVGWGADEHSNTTTVPTLVDTSVVSEGRCLRSSPIFPLITSNRTLCAGNPSKNSGPCLGDSGNGLMIRKNNKWMLRGTVCASMGSPSRPCNVEEYVVYSDIAMFIDWVRDNMLL